MEKIYIENRINSELLNKEFKDWTYETIDFLVYIYDFDQYYPYYNMNLLLLEDYIKWYLENSTKVNNKIYSLEKLCQLRDQIKKDLNISNYYKNILNGNDTINEYAFFDNIFFVFFVIGMIFILIIKLLMSFTLKKESHKKLDNIGKEMNHCYFPEIAIKENKSFSVDPENQCSKEKIENNLSECLKSLLFSQDHLKKDFNFSSLIKLLLKNFI